MNFCISLLLDSSFHIIFRERLKPLTELLMFFTFDGKLFSHFGELYSGFNNLFPREVTRVLNLFPRDLIEGTPKDFLK